MAALVIVAIVVLSLSSAAIGDPCAVPTDLAGGTELLLAPPNTVAQPAWLARIQAWRAACLDSIAFNGSIFEVPELAWTQTSYIQPQMHPFGRFFYDRSDGYTADRWLDDLEKRYGGIDAALIWPTYTNIGASCVGGRIRGPAGSGRTPRTTFPHAQCAGADDRSQFEMISALPGGLDGIRAFVERMKARDVRVLWPYNPW